MRTNKDNLMIKMAIYFNTMIRLSSGKEPKDSPEPWLGNTVLDSLYLYLNFKQVCCYLTVTCVAANVVELRDGQTEKPWIPQETEKPWIQHETKKPKFQEETETPRIQQETEKPRIQQETEKPRQIQIFPNLVKNFDYVSITT